MRLRALSTRPALTWLFGCALGTACVDAGSERGGTSDESVTSQADARAQSSGGQPADASTDVLDSPRAYFRIVDLKLRDPSFFLAGIDVTDSPFLGQSVNGSLIPGGLTMDYDKDGFVDTSILIGLEPWGSGVPADTLRMADAHCRMNDRTRCQSDPNALLTASWSVEERSDGSCLEPIQDSTSSFEARGVVPNAPCLSTKEGRDVVINLGGIPLPMIAARAAASYEEKSSGRLVNGLLQGFVTVESAEATLLPAYLPLLGGTAFSSYLSEDERDDSSSPNGQSGWWVYLNFVAEEVVYAAL